MEYITTKEASEKWGISSIRITVLANKGRIPGAVRLGKIWLIPADATKPEPRRSGRSLSSKGNHENFSFPLYHLRPDYGDIKEAQLSEQQRSLLLAETAVLECRFKDAYTVLETILNSPDDIFTETGCLWCAGICCIALNKPKDFSRIIFRLQILLSEDFPHRDDLTIILDMLKTYVDTIYSTAKDYAININVHYQSLPLTYVLIGYVDLLKEIFESKSADIVLLELGLRFLKSTGATIAMEMMHIYLMGIYCMRQNMDNAEKHAAAAVKIAFETKYYFPLVTFYRYYSQILSPILSLYPKEFRDHCRKMSSQYEKNFSSFLSSLYESTPLSKLTNADLPYAFGVISGMTNACIAEKLGVHPQTVKNNLAKLYLKLGVNSKTEMIEYLRNSM